jgi:hypothetical protein
MNAIPDTGKRHRLRRRHAAADYFSRSTTVVRSMKSFFRECLTTNIFDFCICDGDETPQV